MGVDDQPKDRGGFYFVVGSRTGPWSHTYRVWTSKTSFYIKPRDRALSAMKLSLHGPDPRGMRPGWKLEFDGPRPQSGVLVGEDGDKPKWYDSEEVADGVRRVLRVRVPWYTLDGSLPNGLGAKTFKGEFVGALVPPPQPLNAVDVDFYVSDSEPYWPTVDPVRENNAGMGPLVHESGQVLTAVSHHRSLAKFPTPEGADRIEPMSPEDAIRGLFLAVEKPNGFAWVVETPVPRAAFTDLSTYRSPRVSSELLGTPLRQSTSHLVPRHIAEVMRRAR
ncbi:hypothetical protein [Georgenia subflava]|uniref:Uncharacterized protein n=1 Tax=Georgenia subflava TaxID=1622177 RepID=A0A6N7EFZ2_9MICO|nr:hypothetical protein [Georgenia subflava]MPV36950.1 hypothetical protein [Georgenia subflava]